MLILMQKYPGALLGDTFDVAHLLRLPSYAVYFISLTYSTKLTMMTWVKGYKSLFSLKTRSGPAICISTLDLL
jgi:hypothetical protein